MTFLNTCSEQLRELIGTAKRLSPSNIERFHDQRSDLITGLSQVADMLEGNFSIDAPEEPKANKPRQVKKPHANVIKARNGSVVTVDFKKRRVVMKPEK